MWREIHSSGANAKSPSLDGVNASLPGLSGTERQPVQKESTVQAEPDVQGVAGQSVLKEKSKMQVLRVQEVLPNESKLGTSMEIVLGESSNTPYYLRSVRQRSRSGASQSSQSDIQPDSSDIESSDSELEDGELSKHDLDLGFQVVRNKKKFSGLKYSGQKGDRGRGPKLN